VHTEREVFIRRPVEDVFAYMDDVSREHEWQPGILNAWKEPQGPTVVGTKKTYVSEFLGREIRNTYVARVFEANRHVLYETTADSVLQGRAELRWSASGEGTRVSMSFEGRVAGPLRFVPQRMLESVYRKELGKTLELLKGRLEGGGEGRGA
jgi:carbon monoxide dehydrogenase subunit G